MTTATERKATEPMVRFIGILLDERDLFKSDKFFDAVNAMDAEELAAYIEHLKAQASTLTFEQARGWIVRLKFLPKREDVKEAEQQADKQHPLPDVPEGYYAFDKGLVDVPELGLVEAHFFIAVDRPTKGRWEGRTFVSQVSGGGFGNKGVRHPIRDREIRRMLLATIAEVGIQECAKLYGQKMGRCGCCNRNLTDPVSIAYGIGPDCRKQQGWS